MKAISEETAHLILHTFLGGQSYLTTRQNDTKQETQLRMKRGGENAVRSMSTSLSLEAHKPIFRSQCLPLLHSERKISGFQKFRQMKKAIVRTLQLLGYTHNTCSQDLVQRYADTQKRRARRQASPGLTTETAELKTSEKTHLLEYCLRKTSSELVDYL